MVEQLAEVTAKLLHLPLDGARKVLSKVSEQYVYLSLSKVYAPDVEVLTVAHQSD